MAVSLDDQGMIREACFKVECALGAFGFLLDDFRRIGEYVGRFFIGNKDDFAREIIKSGCMERFQSGEQDADAALHIKNARAVCLPSLMVNGRFSCSPLKNTVSM